MTYINKFLILSYIIIPPSIKYFGFFMPLIDKTYYKQCYLGYKKIAQENKRNNMAGIVIKTQDKIELIPIYKKIIGTVMIENNLYFLDYDGELFECEEENYNDYITVSGEYKYWHKYYKELEKYPQILEKVYHAHIYHYRIDLYLLPGILVKLNRCIKDLNDFYESYSIYFSKPNHYIDLRNTKKVGYSSFEFL